MGLQDGTDGDHPPVLPFPKEEGELRDRLFQLRKRFMNHFGREEPQMYVRVPGRVNLIGEHIDYCGFSVCPMAIQKDILVAVSTSPEYKNFIELTNLEDDVYGDCTFADKEFNIDIGENGWASYFLCGVRGAMEAAASRGSEAAVELRMKAAVAGNIPPGAGLSSSSALVSAAFLATSRTLGLGMIKAEMAVSCADCEKYVGTAGGGMDQAIAFLATKGCAKHIMFNPLRAEELELPEEAVFVIAHSMEMMNKASTSYYNTRVVECRLAAQVLAKQAMSLDWSKVSKLVDLVNAGGGGDGDIRDRLRELANLVMASLHEHPYTRQEVLEILGVDDEELKSKCLTPNTRDLEEFKLRQRALHVYQEALRVEEYCSRRRGSDEVKKKKEEEEEEELERLGRLMTESHQSLTHLYDCSHPSLDALVDVCLKSGAKGARLTGAGWGGCAVAMTTRKEAGTFVSRVEEGYYRARGLEPLFLFLSEPCSGAQLFLTEEQEDVIRPTRDCIPF